MRIEKTDARERLWIQLREATGKGHTSKALDAAARYYLRQHGGTPIQSTGNLEELLQEANARGSLTAAEIVEILDTPELPLEYRQEFVVGND